MRKIIPNLYFKVLESILLRKGLRSDTIWGNHLLFREPFRRIPFYLDTLALLKSQYWPRDKIDTMALKRFKEMVEHASEIPFWYERFKKASIDIRVFDKNDIAKIPLLSKKDFIGRDVRWYTDQRLFSKSQASHTSGSTGKPLHFYHDQQFELRSSAVSERMFRAAGDGKRFPIILMRSFSQMGANFAKYHFFYVRGYNSVRHRIIELKKFMSLFPEGVVLFGLGSSLLELARVCHELNISLPLQRILSTGEELRDSQRKEIEESLKTEVRLSYGMGEIRRLAFECEERRLHMNEEVAYFEITDSYGTPLPYGTKGHVVVTGFENRVMPFIRYDTGDTGVIKESFCPCGRTLRTIEFEGRQVKLLNIGGGRSVSLLDISVLFDRHHREIRQFQIIRTGECAFTMRVVPGTNFEIARDNLTEHFKLRIHPGVSIKWETVESIPEGPRGKAVYFVDEFKKP